MDQAQDYIFEVPRRYSDGNYNAERINDILTRNEIDVYRTGVVPGGLQYRIYFSDKEGMIAFKLAWEN